ncbi:MAG TPA: DUF885 domain-containing protein [Candidatus Binatia bacterium]|jgi:uncharacterized protein (DUF885 family)
MRRELKFLTGALVLLLCCLPVRLSAGEDKLNDAGKILHALFDSEWDYWLEQYPTWASTLGDRRWNDRWENLSLAAIDRRHEHSVEVLGKLTAFDRDALLPPDRLNYELFLKDYENGVEQHRYRWYLIPLHQRGGIQTADELADSLRFETVKDYEDWLARLRAFPVYMEQTIALMREGIKARMLLPKIVLQRVPAQIDHQILGDPKASGFYKPFTKFPAAISAAERERLGAAAGQAIAESVIPSFRRLKEFFRDDYLPASLEQVGIWQLPEGEAMYNFFAREHTTTRLTPAEIHKIGLGEVKRIRAEMQAIIDKLGYRGSFADFLKFLRSDPQFYYKTPEELLEAYRAMTRRIDPLLLKVFKTLPRAPYGVEPIPENIAPDTTTAYYRSPAADGSRAGTYFVNLYKPETRPKYEMMALSLHEAVPGHHLQIALAMEQGQIPNFRRYGGYTAYVEGWGLYAESLGDMMGLYDDPYAKFGQLTYEMWRAARLVVDTGIHYMRWERQRAIDFLLQNTAKQELDVVNEVDRYITLPGQALAYKVGQLKISAIRSKAEQALGPKFDIRAFHDELLKDGALPLDVLEAKMDLWLESQK